MAEYNHTQGSASTNWTISHGLNQDTVIIDVFIVNGVDLEKVLPLNIEHTSNNTTTVTFSVAQTGRVRVIALD